MKEKPFYKKFKVQVLFIAVVLSVLIGTVGSGWTQHTIDLILSVAALAITLIGTSSYTDAKAKLKGLVITGSKEKPFYKKTKFMTATGATILNVVLGIFGDKLSPDITTLIYTATGMAITAMTGHAYNDVAAMIDENVSKK